VDAAELARHRGFDPSFPIEGLGVEEFRILYRETLLDLARMAIDEVGIDDCRMLYVATESAPDLSKPLGVKLVAGNRATIEMKFACVAGSYALMNAWAYTALLGEPAVVLCMDEAIYKAGTSAELTQGAGVVAMKVDSMAKKGLELHFEDYGSYVEDVDDFTRPITEKHPVVDGKLSIISYLYALKMALLDWRKRNAHLIRENVVNSFDYFIYHVPYPKLAQHAFAALYAMEVLGLDRKIHVEDLKSNPDLFEEWRAERKRVMATPEFQKCFEEKVEPSLFLSKRVGNIYTGSIWMALASLLTVGGARGGARIAFGSYGSGMGALAFWARLVGGVEVVILNPSADKVTVVEYDEWRKGRGL